MKSIKIFLSIAALCIATVSFAQQKGPSYIGIGGGASLPLGNWSKSPSIVSTSGFVNDPNGYANTGVFVTVDGAWFFSKHFGIGGMFSYGTYRLKNVDSLSQGYQNSFDVDTTKTTPTNYKMVNFLPGLYFNYPLQKKLSITGRALIGFTYATTPQISVDVIDGGVDDGTFQQESASKTAFAFDIGAGLSYNIQKCLALNFKADYFYAKPDFKINNTHRNNAAGRLVTEYNQPLEALNFSLGITFLFCRK
jgi:opacity protein-like surface antigen